MTPMRARSLVSVIIPTYNRASLVCRAIDSVLAQSHHHLEVIVVDDGSTDATADTLRRYQHRIRVVRQDNGGPSRARNRGIAEASGDFVAFLDSDDTWYPTKIERQVELLEHVGDDVPCCVCNALMVSPDGSSASTFEYADLRPDIAAGIWSNVPQVLLTRFLLTTQALLVRRKALQAVGGFDESLSLLEDHDLALRLSLQGPWAFLAETLVRYHAESPGSLAAGALKAERTLRDCAVRVRWNARQRIAVSGMRALRLQSWCEHFVAKRLLFAAECRADSRPIVSAVGGSIVWADRIRRAMYRRSPWYPRMRVLPPGGASVARA